MDCTGDLGQLAMITGRYLLLVGSLGLFSCIGTAQVSSSGTSRPDRTSAHPEGTQRAQTRRAARCEPTEAATGEITTVETAHCSGTAFENEERTLEPPDIHPY